MLKVGRAEFQDLLADRSTFSSRLLRLREAWDAVGPGSLVLLDRELAEFPEGLAALKNMTRLSLRGNALFPGCF